MWLAGFTVHHIKDLEDSPQVPETAPKGSRVTVWVEKDIESKIQLLAGMAEPMHPLTVTAAEEVIHGCDELSIRGRI